MKYSIVLCAAILMFPAPSRAADYEVDLGSITDYEEIRDLVDGCSDLGELEEHREALESASDLEKLRSFLEGTGHVDLSDCPPGIEIDGVERAG